MQVKRAWRRLIWGHLREYKRLSNSSRFGELVGSLVGHSFGETQFGDPSLEFGARSDGEEDSETNKRSFTPWSLILKRRPLFDGNTGLDISLLLPFNLLSKDDR